MNRWPFVPIYLNPLWPWHSFIYLSDQYLRPRRRSWILTNGSAFFRYLNISSFEFRIGALAKLLRRLRLWLISGLLRFARLVALLTGFLCFILGFNSSYKSGPPFFINGSKKPQVGRLYAAAIFFVNFSIRERNFLKRYFRSSEKNWP